MIMNNYALDNGAAPGQNQFNHSRGYSHEDASLPGKFKKKNVRLIQEHNLNTLQNMNFPTSSSMGQKGSNGMAPNISQGHSSQLGQQQMLVQNVNAGSQPQQPNSALGHVNNQTNQNRKLTPSKTGNGMAMRANSALNQNPAMVAQTLGRTYEQ